MQSLEQLKVEFDDEGNGGEKASLPQGVNSKQKFDYGPSNNSRGQSIKRRKAYNYREAGGGAQLGFMNNDDSNEDDAAPEETKNNWANQGLANRFF